MIRRLGAPCRLQSFQRKNELLQSLSLSLPKLSLSTTVNAANIGVGHKKKPRKGGRHFAYRKNEKKQLEDERKKKKQQRNLQSQLNPPLAAPRAIPPALLSPTGSPFVFVAKTAFAMDEPYGQSPEAALQQSQLLFRDYTTLPRLFETHQFDFVPPSAFGYELPKNGVPEVAFLGRSNVGKSSLVNALMRRNLCQTSKSPGRTQLPFYYGLYSKQSIQPDPADAVGYLVDLPGYGFGMAPKQVVEEWQAKTQDWLLDRRNAGVLKRLFLLFDSRRDSSPIDAGVIEWAESAHIPFTVCLTKADRVGIPKVIRQVNDHCIRFATHDTYQSPVVHVSSSSNKWGINELLTSIEAEFVGDGDDKVE